MRHLLNIFLKYNLRGLAIFFACFCVLTTFILINPKMRSTWDSRDVMLFYMLLFPVYELLQIVLISSEWSWIRHLAISKKKLWILKAQTHFLSVLLFLFTCLFSDLVLHLILKVFEIETIGKTLNFFSLFFETDNSEWFFLQNFYRAIPIIALLLFSWTVLIPSFSSMYSLVQKCSWKSNIVFILGTFISYNIISNLNRFGLIYSYLFLFILMVYVALKVNSFTLSVPIKKIIVPHVLGGSFFILFFSFFIFHYYNSSHLGKHVEARLMIGKKNSVEEVKKYLADSEVQCGDKAKLINSNIIGYDKTNRVPVSYFQDEIRFILNQPKCSSFNEAFLYFKYDKLDLSLLTTILEKLDIHNSLYENEVQKLQVSMFELNLSTKEIISLFNRDGSQWMTNRFVLHWLKYYPYDNDIDKFLKDNIGFLYENKKNDLLQLLSVHHLEPYDNLKTLDKEKVASFVSNKRVPASMNQNADCKDDVSSEDVINAKDEESYKKTMSCLFKRVNRDRIISSIYFFPTYEKRDSVKKCFKLDSKFKGCNN